MKVLALISNFSCSNTGRGGHYYSFATIVNACRTTIGESAVLSRSIGDSIPVPLARHEWNAHAFCSLSDFTEVISQLTQLCSDEKVTIVHAYDVLSGFAALSISQRLKIPYLVTKCGGAPLPSYYPVHKNNVVFNRTDQVAMLRHCVSRPEAIWVLPGRVDVAVDSSLRAPSVPKGCSELVIGRIGRIGSTYRYAIESSIRLVEMISNLGVPAKLVVVGHVEDVGVYQDLKSLAGTSATFIVDDISTANAQLMLTSFDAVVATGRGAHEALAKGIPTFCAFSGGCVPVFITSKTVVGASKSNFSRRFAPATDPNESVREFVAFWQSGEAARKGYALWAIQYFNRFYSVSTTSRRLAEIYENLSYSANGALLLYSKLWFKCYVIAKRLVRNLNRIY